MTRWRAFVYGNKDFGTEELVKQSYSTFKPLDGQFDSNVILQIKNGPMDFQIREPLHPLLGAMKETNVMMAVQAAQEYTGQQIHAVNLVTMWEEYLEFDTKHDGPGSTIKKLLSNTSTPDSTPGKKHSGRISGMACVSNFGAYANWTGHVLAGSNSFGFGRLSWSGGSLTSEEINTEWAQLTFPPLAKTATAGEAAAGTTTEGAALPVAAAGGSASVVDKVVDILQRSREIYEGYTSPLGIGFIVFGGGDYKPGAGACASFIDGAWSPSPASRSPGAGPNGEACPTSPGLSSAAADGSGSGSQRRRLDLHGGLDHYWVDPCSNTGMGNYSYRAIGCDRTTNSKYGTGYAGDYHPDNTAMFNSVETCPIKNLLWFHNLPWTHPMPKPANYTPGPGATAAAATDAMSGNDTVTLYDHIRFTHFDSVKQAEGLAAQWDTLKGLVDEARFMGVQGRFAQQVRDATQMAHDIMMQYEHWAHKATTRAAMKTDDTNTNPCFAGHPMMNNPCLIKGSNFSKLKYCDHTAPLEQRIADAISHMSLTEKIGALGTVWPATPSLGMSCYNWYTEATSGISWAHCGACTYSVEYIYIIKSPFSA